MFSAFKTFSAATAALFSVGVLLTLSSPVAGARQMPTQVLRGTLVHRVAEFGSARETDSWWLRNATGLTQLDVDGTPSAAPGSRVTMRGTADRRGVLTVAGNGIREADSTGAETPTPRTSARLAVILFRPSSGASVISQAGARSTYFGAADSAAQFFKEASNGTFALNGDVLGPYVLAGLDTSECMVDDWSAAARQAAKAAGVDLSTYSNVAFVFPWVAACPWGGMAEASGSNSWINGLTSDQIGVYHAAHELGHNFGSGHAHAYRCTSDGQPVVIGPESDCTTDEYGDPFSVMGNGVIRLPNGWERAQMGFLAPGAQLVVDRPGVLRVRLSVLERTGGVRLVLVRRADGSFLDLEYRRPFGSFDAYPAGDPAVRGVTLEFMPSGLSPETSLLDTRPGTATFDDATLTAGHGVSDTDGGVGVSVVSADDTGATLDITIVDKQPTEGGDTSAPLAPAGLHATADSAGVQLSWQAALDDVEATAYVISRDGSAVGESPDLSFDDATTSGSAHTYAVAAVDEAGNLGPAAQVSYAPADVSAPSRPSSLQLRRTSTTTVQLRWLPAADNVSVARYRVQVDNRPAISATRLSVTLRSLRRGSHVFRVWAVDGAGNVGAVIRVTRRI